MTTDQLERVCGDATGLLIPAHAEAFRADGAAFLTRALQSFGALPASNSVARVTRLEPCAGGSTGAKLFLSVEYSHPDPALHTDLFVKFSRDFTDPMRDRQRSEMEPEARFAPITRLPGFPISVPAAYFADYHRASGTGLIITQRIRFGENGVEKQHRKCADHELADPLPYYHALFTALARLAGAHKAGRLSADIETRFPYDAAAASADPIRYDAAQLADVLASCASFAARCPQLLPPEVCTEEFLNRLHRDARRIREHEPALQTYLRGNRDFITLNHWNAHIDNAWFWRDSAGALQCGLIDWGRVSQITFGAALWGCLSAAHHDIVAFHLDALLELFASEYHAHGGLKISTEELELHLMLHIATMGVARVLAMPSVVLYRLPEAANASGPRDPVFEKSDSARNCLHIYTVLLNLWRARDFGARLDELLARV